MKKSMKLAVAALAVAGVGAGSTAIAAEQMGVSKNEIVIGTIQDLSGPLAGFGKALRFGMQMRVDEVNESGGINGRKLKFIAEDSGYDPKKGLLAAQKMVQQDKLFAMVGTIGTAVNLATFPTLFDKGVMNLFPLTAAREMYEPLHKLKFSFAAPYYNQIRMGVKWMAKERGAKKFCVIYQDDDFGTEVLKGAEDGLKDINMTFAEKTSFKRGATDFSAQVSKMKAADCDTVVLGTIIRETIGTIGTARKMGWNPNFIGSSAAYTDLIHKLGGKAMDGLYAMHQVAVPYADDSSKNVRDWFAVLQGQVQRGTRPVLRLRLRGDGHVRADGEEDRGQPDHRQLHQDAGEPPPSRATCSAAPSTSSDPSSTWATTSPRSARSRTAAGLP
jgi:branched-chain amino acid transport system substrate-binding protein